MIYKKGILLFAFVLLSGIKSAAQGSATNNPLRDSLAVAAQLLDSHPDSIDLRLKKAAWNMELEQWQYAREEYDFILAQEPKNLAALYFRAYANTRLRRYNYARMDYESMLAQVPNHFEGRLGLALLNQADRHYTEALDGINLLVTAHPDSAVVWAARAGIEVEQGMLELAEYDFTEALARAPHHRDYLLQRADVRIKLGKWDQAREDLDQLVRMGVPKAALKEWYNKM